MGQLSKIRKQKSEYIKVQTQTCKGQLPSEQLSFLPHFILFYFLFCIDTYIDL